MVWGDFPPDWREDTASGSCAVVWRENASRRQGSEVKLGRWVGERRKAAVSLQNSISELTTLKCWILTGHFIRYLRLRAAPGGHFISHEKMSRRDGSTVREERQ